MGEVGERLDKYYSVIVPIYKSEVAYGCLFSFLGNERSMIKFKCMGLLGSFEFAFDT